MPKTYYNTAISGNGRLLCCLSDKGGIVRIFWPDIDYPQNIEKFSAGLFIPGTGCGALWLNGDMWNAVQEYEDDTSNVVITSYKHEYHGIELRQRDFVPPAYGAADLVVRQYVLNYHGGQTGPDVIDPILVLLTGMVSTSADPAFTAFDPDAGCMIFSRHDIAFCVFSDKEMNQYQIGGDVAKASSECRFCGCDTIGLSHEAAMSFRLGHAKRGEEIRFTVYICFASGYNAVPGIVKGLRKSGAELAEKLADQNRNFWNGFGSCRGRIVQASDNGVGTGRYGQKIRRLYNRSRMVFRLLSDDTHGGILAAPEMDEEYSRCGRYGYCWPRDGGFIAWALDLCGLDDLSRKFFEWAAKAQLNNGSWHQRYYMNGTAAPSWGDQYDETGTTVWGIYRHFVHTGDMGFIENMWECVSRAMEFLASCVDPQTGVPAPCFDIWEERCGEHAYTSAAVYGGLVAGAETARLLGMDDGAVSRWRTIASGIRSNLLKLFWKPEEGLMLRSIRVKPNPWREAAKEDFAADVSLLGLCIPFGVFSPDDEVMKATAARVERRLAVPAPGIGSGACSGYGAGSGVMRYENDTYMGGNPWIIANLWLALYFIRAGECNKALKYFEWVLDRHTQLYLLPEQADKFTGLPSWVFPLTWSHAMFIIVLHELIGAGAMKEGDIS